MNQKQIKKDWDSRGYSFGIFKDPPGKIWAEFVIGQTNLLYCQRERLRLKLKAIHSSLRLVMRFSFLPKLSTLTGILVRQIMSGIMDTKILERVPDCEELVGGIRLST